jgi:hypothetical protein
MLNAQKVENELTPKIIECDLPGFHPVKKSPLKWNRYHLFEKSQQLFVHGFNRLQKVLETLPKMLL